MRGNGSKMQAYRRADDRVEITTDSGERVWAAAPVIVSASRATDIPACYTEWFFRRLQRGYAVRRNPFNNTRVPVSFARTRVVVFWSKNPRPLLPRLGELEEREIHSLLHYTLNDYVAEGFEPNLPPLDERIDTFRACAERLGRDRVIWRFDPLLLTDRLDVGELLHRIGRLGDRLSGYTSKLVFSFADIRNYRRVAANLDRAAVRWREFSPAEAGEFAARVRKLNRRWGLDLATCGEPADLSRYGIAHNRCIDDSLLVRLFPGDRVLMEHLGAAPAHSSAPRPNRPTGKTPDNVPPAAAARRGTSEATGPVPTAASTATRTPRPSRGVPHTSAWSGIPTAKVSDNRHRNIRGIARRRRDGARMCCVVPFGTEGITKRKDRACSRASERPAPRRRRGRTRPILTPTSRHRAPRVRAAAPSPHG